MDEYVLRFNNTDSELVVRRISLFLSNYLVDIYRYNRLIRDRNYYLKPVHVVVKKTSSSITKYVYYGRYWYRLVKKPGGIKWVYIGKNKPEKDLPDPPPNPLEGLVLKIDNNGLTILASSLEIYDRIKNILVSSQNPS